MTGLWEYPDTLCGTGGTSRGHYVYPSKYVVHLSGAPQGRCNQCERICEYIPYTLGVGTTAYLWVVYHYPIIEWP